MARLRSRISWLKEGDANTKFFHLHARHRKKKNFVAKLVDGNRILTNHSEKAAVVDDYSSKLIGLCRDRSRTRVIDLEALAVPKTQQGQFRHPFFRARSVGDH
jgi:hypothetical protein